MPINWSSKSIPRRIKINFPRSLILRCDCSFYFTLGCTQNYLPTTHQHRSSICNSVSLQLPLFHTHVSRLPLLSYGQATLPSYSTHSLFPFSALSKLKNKPYLLSHTNSDKEILALSCYRSNMGSGAGNFLKVVLKNFDVLAGPVISLVYPLYASIRAIESKSPVDDQQWLTYWVLYSLITLFELTFAKVLEWIPIWPYAKLIVTCWLVLPYFSGAAYVYEHYVRPFFVNPQTINIWYVPSKKETFGKKDDILTAAEKYIQENGTEAFENLINRADKSRRDGDHYTMYGESY